MNRCMIGFGGTQNTVGVCSIDRMKFSTPPIPAKGLCACVVRTNRVNNMSDDESQNEEAEKTETIVSENSDESSNADAMKNRFKLIEGEEVLLTKSPSPLGFMGMYFLGIIVFTVHLVFWKPDSLLNDNSGGFAKFLVWVMGLGGSKLPFGFVLVMATVTWFNRMLNTSTSGKWVTIWLLLATLAPVLIQLDGLIALIRDLFSDADVEPFLGLKYNFLVAGLVLTFTYWALVFYYQRSFDYAITSNAVIFKHSFLLSRAHRRILFDRISEVQVERTPFGTMTGFATLTILTDSGVGIVEESVGGSVGVSPNLPEKADDTSVEKAGKGLLKSFFALMFYQRTIRTVRPDPKHCFYKIRGWEDTKTLLNEMHKKHSQSTKLDNLADILTQANEGQE